MASPNSRQTLIDYCLRTLGKPVIEINIDDDQIEDRVDEAIQFYREYHSDAVIKTYRKHQITATDISNKYITIPDQLLFVSRIFPVVSNSSSGYANMFSARYQMHLNDIYDLNFAGALVNYVMTKSFLEMLDMTLNGTPATRFNRHMNRLYIDLEWTNLLIENEWIIIEGYETINPDTYTDVYNDAFLKKYTTALLKRQWGQNLSKFEGIQLPGGVTMNGMAILDSANVEIAQLEEEMESKYSTPVDFFVG